MSKFRTVPFEFHILVGLPGSGKTYWATHNYPTNYFLNHNGRMIVDLDKFKDCGDKMLMNALDEEFKNYMTACHVNRVDVCIDGLVTTYDDLYNLIYGILMYMQHKCTWKLNKFGDFKFSFIIHQWDENREVCIYNDNMRNRDVKAKSSIKNLPYENINVKQVENHLRSNLVIEKILGDSYDSKVVQIEKIEHKVKKTTLYKTLFEPECVYQHNDPCAEKGRYIYSESWSLGGEGGNYLGKKWSVSKQEQKEFVELDDFLIKVAPNISFLQYKRIFNHCVDKVEWHEYDYYSAGTDETCWRCDMKKLYETLKEMNLIKEME